MKLLHADTLEQAREKLLAADVLPPRKETVPIADACGRILAEDITAPISVPDFAKSTVDGYAVLAKDTQGAGESIPCFLDIIGEVSIGDPAELMIAPGQCAYVPTGGMLPEGADAMVMVEHAERFDEKSCAVSAAVSPGTGVVLPGDDIRAGEEVLKKGSVIGARQAAVLAALGIGRIPVFSPPAVTVISTGDELVPPGESKGPGKIYDINTWSISGLAADAGMRVIRRCALEDDRDLISAAIRKAMDDSDIIAVSGGSSKGKKDFTATVLDELAEPGVFTHGIAVKPGKPTILASDTASRTLLIGLPGHPAAAMMVFDLLIAWLWRQRTGVPDKRSIQAVMAVNTPGGEGRTLCLPVRLERSVHGTGAFPEKDDPSGGDRSAAFGSGWTACPLPGRSALISSLAGADGYIVIDAGKEGLKKGETVDVIPL